ncbi:recombinase family protein [Rhodococcus aetherivorans]|uniref:recombinase family protein n=2 Tax=Rhodococcus aetherivorans TaxID=191292 RepID=UPI0005CB2DD2|nr:recombinase family protein [Rhodococcus aetherivorans]
MVAVGYARVSTTDQNPQLQIDALEAVRVARVFTDRGVSGAKTSRPQLDAALDYVREGDTLVVRKLDRLGRNTRSILEMIDGLHERGVGFRSLTEGITTEGPMGRAMLTIMAAFAQLERDTMIERTRAGLAAAAANGRKGGRRPKLDERQVKRARELRASGMTANEVGKIMDCSRATVYRYLATETDLSSADDTAL